MTRVGAILFFLLAATGGASAADDVIADPVPVPSSARFANAADYDWGGVRVGIQGGYAWTNYGALSGDGAFGGAHAGYDHQIGRGVIGLQSSVTAGDIEVAPGASLKTIVDVRARLGYSMDRVLVYGTAGGAYGTADGGLDDTGWTAGAGVDFAPTERTIIGMEWIKYRFKDFANTGNTLEVDLVEGKVTYKF